MHLLLTLYIQIRKKKEEDWLCLLLTSACFSDISKQETFSVVVCSSFLSVGTKCFQ